MPGLILTLTLAALLIGALGEFCGSIGFRWQIGTTALPPHCLGHIGYSVVPWKRGLGYATRALALLLPDARREGLEFVEITADVHNLASRRVIEANGGVFVERFTKVAEQGSTEALRFRIFFRPERAHLETDPAPWP
jgi:predicted acetyltransferase